MRLVRTIGIFGVLCSSVAALACTAPIDAAGDSAGDTKTGAREQTGTASAASNAFFANPSGRFQLAVYDSGMFWFDRDHDGALGFNHEMRADFWPTVASPMAGTRTPIKVRRTVNGVEGDVVGVFKDGTWNIDSNGSMNSDSGDVQYGFGTSGDTPVSGNWSVTGIGVFNAGKWTLDLNGDGRSYRERPFIYGQAGDIPVVGDWTGDGKSKIGIYRAGIFYLDANNNHVLDDAGYAFGGASDTPVVGKWFDNVDRLGVFNNGNWVLDANGSGAYDAGDVSTYYGSAGTIPFAGQWASFSEAAVICDGTSQCTDRTRWAGLGGPLTDGETNYETQYVAMVDFLWPTTAVSPPTTYSLTAGGVASPLSWAGNAPQVVTVIGSQGLGYTNSNTRATASAISKATSAAGTVMLSINGTLLYSAPTLNTILRWNDKARDEATILGLRSEHYQSVKQFALVTNFDAATLQQVIDQAKTNRAASIDPDEQDSWDNLISSLTGWQNNKPVDGDPSTWPATVQQLANTAKTALLQEMDRAQRIIDLFDAATTTLNGVTSQTSDQVEIIRSQLQQQLTANQADLVKLKTALITASQNAV